MKYYTYNRKLYIMKSRIIPRNDSLCALCRIREADKTGSHMVPNLLTAVTFSFDGKTKRDREIVELYHINSPEDNAIYYGSQVAPEKITEDLGHEITDEELEKNTNLLCYDNIFCHQCENRFGVLETAYGEYYKGLKNDINPRIAYLFWLSVYWRMAIGYMGIFMDGEDEFALRDILNENIHSHNKIINSKGKLGDYGYVIFRVKDGIIKGDSGILGTRTSHCPYIILVADYVVALFNNYNKLHNKVNIFNWEIYKEDINTPDKPFDYIEISIEEFYEFRDNIIDNGYSEGLGAEREKLARKIREFERLQGKLLNKHEVKKLMNMARLVDSENVHLRIRKLYRFEAAYTKMIEAQKNGISYDFLTDRQLMLNQEDINNYIVDLQNLRKHNYSIDGFPFAKEFLEDETITSFEEIINKYRPI